MPANAWALMACLHLTVVLTVAKCYPHCRSRTGGGTWGRSWRRCRPVSLGWAGGTSAGLEGRANKAHAQMANSQQTTPMPPLYQAGSVARPPPPFHGPAPLPALHQHYRLPTSCALPAGEVVRPPLPGTEGEPPAEEPGG